MCGGETLYSLILKASKLKSILHVKNKKCRFLKRDIIERKSQAKFKEI